MKKALIIFVLSFIGFSIFQLLIPFVFGMGELQLGKLAFTAYGLYLDKEHEEIWIVTLNWLMREYAPILIYSLQFAIAALLLNTFQQSRKILHSIQGANQILLGSALYFLMISLLGVGLQVGTEYASYYMRSGSSSLNFITTIATFYTFANLLLLVLLAIFIFSAIKKK